VNRDTAPKQTGRPAYSDSLAASRASSQALKILATLSARQSPTTPTCDVTRLSPGLPAVYELRHMKWTTWAKRPEGQGLVEGKMNTVRLKKKRPCGRHGQHNVYSKMSIAGGPFRPILYCGD
jgi:hypothetical protein